MIDRFALLAVGAAIFVGFGLAGSAAAADAAPGAIKVAVSGALNEAPMDLARRRGYFEQQGLSVDWVPSGGAAQDVMVALARNDISAVARAPNVGLFNALDRGLDVRLVGDLNRVATAPDDGGVGLVVRADLIESGAIKTPADLKGRIFNAGPTNGSYADILIAKVLAKAGLTPGDVSFEKLSFGDAMVALSNKSIDATALFEPLITRARLQHLGDLFVTASSVDPGAESSVLFFSTDFAKDKAAATKFMIAYIQGLRDYDDAFVHHKNRDAAIAILAKDYAIDDPQVWKTMAPLVADLNGDVNVPNVKSQAAFFAAEGALSGPIPDIDKIVDLEFAQAAAKALGRR